MDDGSVVTRGAGGGSHARRGVGDTGLLAAGTDVGL